MLHLVLASLCVFWAWECLTALLPIALPAWLQPILVLGGAVGARYLPIPALYVGAICGVVALLHQLLSVMEQVIRTRNVRRVPRI